MPGHYIHITAAEKISEHLAKIDNWPLRSEDISLPNIQGPSPMELAKIATAHPNYYRLGAVGPDLFFFMPDFRKGLSKPLISIINFYESFYGALDQWIIGPYEKVVGPTAENWDEIINNSTGGVEQLLNEILAELSAIEMKAILDIATQAKDWFELFSLGLNRGYDNKDFFWSDMLHYRNTSEFALNMWKILQDKSELEKLFDNDDEVMKRGMKNDVIDGLHAYVIGYMTHLGVDTTGHAFVNEKCGGPFRTHWQRHHLVENHMDAKTYDDEHGSEATYSQLTESALYFKLQMDEDGTEFTNPPLPYDPNKLGTLRERYKLRRHLDIDATMPPPLARLLLTSMDKTFHTLDQKDIQTLPDILNRTSPDILPDDGRPTVENTQYAYDLFFKYLKWVTVDGFNCEKPSPPEVTADFEWPLFNDPNEDDGAPGEDDLSNQPGDNFWDKLWHLLAKILLAIARAILWLVTIGPYLASYLLNQVTGPLTYRLRLAAYYGIELPMYNMVKALRQVLVMTGYSLPMKDEIDIGLVKLGTGSEELFASTLKSIDDVLTNIADSQVLAELQHDLDTLIPNSGISFSDGIATLLGELDLSNTIPNEPIPDPFYPHSHPDDEFHHPWLYPVDPKVAPGEELLTYAGPYLAGSMPHILLENSIPGTQKIRHMFEKAKKPEETHSVYNSIDVHSNLGDPINFSSYLMWQLTRSSIDSDVTRITNWNLDSDRGYGYKCWDWKRHLEGENLIDPDEEGHPYLRPCTPPPQSNESPSSTAPTPSSIPLQLYYPDETPNPGCDKPITQKSHVTSVNKSSEKQNRVKTSKGKSRTRAPVRL